MTVNSVLPPENTPIKRGNIHGLSGNNPGACTSFSHLKAASLMLVFY
jgi:hypothetical protein